MGLFVLLWNGRMMSLTNTWMYGWSKEWIYGKSDGEDKHDV